MRSEASGAGARVERAESASPGGPSVAVAEDGLVVEIPLPGA